MGYCDAISGIEVFSLAQSAAQARPHIRVAIAAAHDCRQHSATQPPPPLLPSLGQLNPLIQSSHDDESTQKLEVAELAAEVEGLKKPHQHRYPLLIILETSATNPLPQGLLPVVGGGASSSSANSVKLNAEPII